MFESFDRTRSPMVFSSSIFVEDLSNSAAVVTNNAAQGNNPCVPPVGMNADLRDDNPDCGGNTWDGNTFDTSVVDQGSGPQDCIQ